MIVYKNDILTFCNKIYFHWVITLFRYYFFFYLLMSPRELFYAYRNEGHRGDLWASYGGEQSDRQGGPTPVKNYLILAVFQVGFSVERPFFFFIVGY